MRLHALLPYDLCIGWDLFIDKSGKRIALEWNGEHKLDTIW
jgi:hypothetical protein